MKEDDKISIEDTRDLYIPFAALANVAGISPKRIRNWLDNGHVYLDGDKKRADPGKHRRFSRLDVARVGLVARLTTVGFSAERASNIVEQFLYNAIEMANKKRGKEKELPAYVFQHPKGYDLHQALTIFQTPEPEILEELRDLSFVIRVESFDISEGYPEDYQPNFTYLPYKKGTKPGKYWASEGDGPDTRITVEVWQMMRTQDEALEKAGLE